MTASPDRLSRLLEDMRSGTPRMLAALETLVGVESPSADLAATSLCADAVAAMGAELLGASPERVVASGRVHLRWRFGASTRVLLVGHFDTVWPVGTLARWPFSVQEGRATGPGVFDMKAGVVQSLYAAAALEERAGLTLLLTSDEELGSKTSRHLVESSAMGAAAALITEPAAAGGAVKTGRKGVSMYDVTVHGVAAHASDPARGANASLEAARLMLQVETFGDRAAGTTVTPTLLQGGVTQNTIPDRAWFYTDCRVATAAEEQRVLAAMRGLGAADPRLRVEVSGGPNRPPFPASFGEPLYERLARLAAGMGLVAPGAAFVPGGSDGNFTAAMGVPTLDGLGAVGDLAHGEGEYVVVDAIPERAAMLAAMLEELLLTLPAGS
ncbi:MAG: M20/M25/M40 family metallo-hydrolase [Candidatus Dormibacteria bacterium]